MTKTAKTAASMRSYRSPKAIDRLYRVVHGGHLIHLLPEELTVITDPDHFCCDHADPSRTSRDDPDLQDFYRFCLAYGVPGEIVAKQDDPETVPDGAFRTIVVDGRRHRAVVEWINEGLRKEGKEPIKLAVRVRNDLNETQIRELIARLNEGGKPPSLAQRIGQAVGFEKQYTREILARNARAPIDAELMAKRIAANFPRIGAETVKRWLKVPRFAVEAQVVIETGRGPIDIVDDFAKLTLDEQRQACESLGDISEPKAVKAAVQKFVERKTAEKPTSGTNPAPTEKPKRPRKQAEWDALDKALEAHKELEGVRIFQQIARWQRGEIEEIAVRFALGVPIEEEEQPAPLPPVDTTTQAGRSAYQRSVFEALAAEPDAWLASGEIVAQCGGTPDQMHRALKALCKLGLVEKIGNAVHTKYQVVPGAEWPEEVENSKAANSAPVDARLAVVPGNGPLDLRTQAGRAALDQRVLAALQQLRKASLAELVTETKSCESGVRASLKRLGDAVARSGRGPSTRFALTSLAGVEEEEEDAEEEKDEDAEEEEDEDAKEEEDEDAKEEEDEDAKDTRTLELFPNAAPEDVC